MRSFPGRNENLFGITIVFSEMGPDRNLVRTKNIFRRNYPILRLYSAWADDPTTTMSTKKKPSDEGKVRRRVDKVSSEKITKGTPTIFQSARILRKCWIGRDYGLLTSVDRFAIARWARCLPEPRSSCSELGGGGGALENGSPKVKKSSSLLILGGVFVVREMVSRSEVDDGVKKKLSVLPADLTVEEGPARVLAEVYRGRGKRAKGRRSPPCSSTRSRQRTKS